MLGIAGVALLVFAAALACWPDRFRVERPNAELIGGALFVLGLVLIGIRLSVFFG